LSVRGRRGTRIALICVGVALFVAISGILARYLSAENVERDREAALLQAQVEGNVQGMLDQLTGCRASA
jgi:predicted transcriptional regulator YheO